jgi:hypothetical protein
MVEVEIKKESTEKLIDIVSSQSAAVAVEEDAVKIQADAKILLLLKLMKLRQQQTKS